MKIDKDIKYIIKKVLIIVLSSIILFNMKKCNVFAESNTLYFQDRSFGYFTSDGVSNFYENPPSRPEFWLNFGQMPLDVNTNINIFFRALGYTPTNTSPYLYFYNEVHHTGIYWSEANLGNVCSEFKNVNFDLIGNSTYPITLTCSESTSYDSLNWNTGYQHFYIFSTDYNYINTLFSSFDFPSSFSVATYTKNNSNYYWTHSSTQNVNGNSLYEFLTSEYFQDFELYNSNLQNVYINNEEVPINNDIIPGYSKIDISDYQAVYFIPKNYKQIYDLYSPNDVNFDYYYIGQMSDAYFPLQYTSYINILNKDLFSYARTHIESHYPLTQTISNSVVQDFLGLTEFKYFGYLIYNQNQNIDLPSYVWYDNQKYDYYLVSDLSEYIQNVCFKDETESDLCIDITFTDSVESLFDDSLGTGGSDWSESENQNNIQGYLDFLTMPFNFLKGLNKNSCQPITIPLPFVSGNIQINCLSSMFQGILGNFYYILVAVINGLVVYRITIRNIDTLTDTLDPNDDKIEVIDL